MKEEFILKKGFTFIEVLISLAILSLIILGISISLSKNIKLWLTTDQQRDIQQSARLASKYMVVEIKQAGYIFGNMINNGDGIGGPDPAIYEANISSMTFFGVVRDADGDRVKDSTTTWVNNLDRERITYLVQNGRVKREAMTRFSLPFGPPDDVRWITQPLVKVTGLTFDYMDENGVSLLAGPHVPPGQRQDIRLISFTLRIKRGKETITLTSEVRPRNL